MSELNNLRHRAFAFAVNAHRGQLRKYTGQPYATHCVEVALWLMSIDMADEVIAAGYLHDVLEDTPTTFGDLRREFGDQVTALVLQVTDVSARCDGNRARRKALDRAHLATASPEGQTIKLADLISNTGSIVQYDPGFARVYLPEERALLNVLTLGDARLMAEARSRLDAGERTLAMLEAGRCGVEQPGSSARS